MIYLHKKSSINDLVGIPVREPNIIYTKDKGLLYVKDIPDVEKEVLFNALGQYTVIEDVNPLRPLEYYHTPHDFGTKLYSVGLMSDVHYDDTCAANENEHSSEDSGNTFNPYEDLENVLIYYNEDKNVDFVACAGDISTNSIEHVHSFYERAKILSPDTPIYTCKGNHDNYAAYNNNELWLQYTIPTNGKYDIHYFTTGDNTSFYFVTENNDVYIYFNVDYNNGYSANAGWDGTNNIYYNPDTIIELQQLLDTYRNNRCFIFTHQYFSQKSGNPNYDYSYGHGWAYFLSGYQFAILNAINNYYKNCVWFSGHTHYQWRWESITERANICNFDILNNNYDYTDVNNYCTNTNGQYDLSWHTNCIQSAWNVHLPSTCRPLRPQRYLGISNYSDAIADPGSEGAIMDVYPDGVNIRGIIFADENTPVTTNEEILYQMPITTSFTVDDTKAGYDGNQEVYEEDGYIVLKYTKPAQRFIQTEYMGSHLYFDDIQVIDGNGENITEKRKALSDPLIGVISSADKYTLNNCDAMVRVVTLKDSTVIVGLEHLCSSRITETFPLYVKMKGISATIGQTTTTINYENKFDENADYWLPVGGANSINIESKPYSYFENIIEAMQNN